MSPARHRFTGVANIIRFNRGKYAAAVVAVVALSAAAAADTSLRVPLLIAITSILIGVMISLGVSYWVYDASNLYDFRWSDTMQDNDRIAVVYAGWWDA